MRLRTLHYDELSTDELYTILQLRQEVFIVEQDCPYLDCDNKDKESFHVLCENEEGTLVAYTRLVPRGVSYAEYASIGRVANALSVRGKGVGKHVMEYSMAECRRLFPQDNLKISAQSYLLGFYSSLGFEAVGEEYLEDDIPHTAMVLLQF